MPSSKSSLDKRDVYYRKGKSDGYRARSAYKLLHLDEEFDLFRGVQTAVDLCAAPGSWSQVLGQRLKPQSSAARVVSIDLQPMAPLPGITTLQTDITRPDTVPRVLDALGGRKADLVVCDGAPDVTGVHDLDAYLHSQLLLAALTLSLTLMAPGATLIFKIFLSPLDPSAAVLRSQLRAFFPGPPPGTCDESCNGDHAGSFSDEVGEFDDTRTDSDPKQSSLLHQPQHQNNAEATRSGWGPGYDALGRPGGVWVRKPRSSRKGSGEAFIVARNFDPSTLPLQLDDLAALRDHVGGTLTLESLAHIGTETAPLDSWPATRAFVGGGDLGSSASSPPKNNSPTVPLNLNNHNRQSSLGSIDGAPSPVEPEFLFPEPNGVASLRAPPGTRFRSGSDAMSQVTTPIPLPTPMPSLFGGPSTREFSKLSTSPLSNLYPHGFGTPHQHVFGGGSWAGSSVPSPGPGLSAREREVLAGTPHADGAVSPALSASSKTDAFFSTSQRDTLPVPPPPLAGAPAALGRASSIGRGRPAGPPPNTIRTRVVTTPATPICDSPISMTAAATTSPTSPVFNPTPLRSVTGPVSSTLAPSGIASSRPARLLSPPRGVPVRADVHISREEHHGDEAEVQLHAGDVLVPVPDDDSLAIRSSENPGQWRLIKPLGQGAFAFVWAAESEGPNAYEPEGGVVAVKLVERATAARSQRTAISFYREVEVLRHLVHPNIVGYIAHFSTASYHCLVLERLAGGELFSLVAHQSNAERMIRPSIGDPDGYGFIRRVFGELSRAVAWLHEVEVVHRDIKLENILFTVNPFTLPPTSTGGIPLDALPVPLVKLSDFGLSRFIRSSSPLLATRCGSEAYAAPEVVMGNLYDGRKTDAWALGVVLYALVAGELPFEDGAPLPPGRARAGSTASVGSDSPRESRRRTMHRIAKGEYGWRDGVGSSGVRHVVSRLLTRDPARRARVAQLWDEDWMRSGAGAVPPPNEAMRATVVNGTGTVEWGPNGVTDIPRRASDAPHVVVAGGVLVDHERIDEVALLDVSASEA